MHLHDDMVKLSFAVLADVELVGGQISHHLALV